MATHLRLAVKLPLSGPNVSDYYTRPVTDLHGSVEALIRLLEGIQAGTVPARLALEVLTLDANDALYSGQVVLTHANLTNNVDTLTIGGVVLTWRNTPTDEDSITIGANVTADGDNLVATLAAHSKLKNVVVGSNAAGTVTLTSPLGVRLATNDATAMALTQMSAQAPTTQAVLARGWVRGQT